MKTIEVYDPPMCCSTGVCGTSVNPELVRVASDLDKLGKSGVAVKRYNLSQQPEAFVINPLVQDQLTDKGVDALPIVLVDGELLVSGRYPTTEELTAATRN